GWFQSTRPRGARRNAAGYRGTDDCFNPRARAGRDPKTVAIGHNSQSFQSTRPRGARQVIVGPPQTNTVVSIHAPARGATPVRTCTAPRDPVSIHAPARGA